MNVCVRAYVCVCVRARVCDRSIIGVPTHPITTTADPHHSKGEARCLHVFPKDPAVRAQRPGYVEVRALACFVACIYVYTYTYVCMCTYMCGYMWMMC